MGSFFVFVKRRRLGAVYFLMEVLVLPLLVVNSLVGCF